MHASIHAFLDQIVDYAGLFPPAKLPLEEALRKYLRYRKESPHAWMLGRLVCPARRLADLLPLAKDHADASLLSLAVLGQQGAGSSDFLTELATDIGAIEAFRDAWEADAVIDTIEVSLPKEGDADAFARHVGYAAEHLVQAKLRGFLEIPMSAQWQDDTDKIAQALGSLYDTWDQGLLGLKLRCGGLTGDVFPTDAEVAFFIARCNEAEIPWKATAGLHHPRRHWDEALKVWHHGFLNVFAAAVLAWNNTLTEEDLVEILADRDGQHFRFEENCFAWKKFECTTAQIAEARRDFATSFGCCSFEEPCVDLLALGLLDEPR